MNSPPSVGTCVVFSQSYGDFRTQKSYAFVAILPIDYVMVEIDLRNPALARNVKKLNKQKLAELLAAGFGTINSLPPLPQFKREKKLIKDSTELEGVHEEHINARLKKLEPVLEKKAEILSSRDPAKTFNEYAKAAGLNVTRTRAHFFWLAAYSFEPSSLMPAYWNSGPNKEEPQSLLEEIAAKRGPKVKDPSITPVGWSFDKKNWPEKIMSGWNAYAIPGTTYQKVFTKTLVHKFGCKANTSTSPAVIYHPDGDSFPTRTQWRNYVIGKIGKPAWEAAKFGEQTRRNNSTTSAHTISQYLINLLEEVQWDAQELDELPGNIRDPSQPGKAIIRVVATCCTCGGPVGIGYDYGAESKWGYLMALLSMAMKKSEFAQLFGVEISDDDWAAIGVMAAVRGDRGPAIGRGVTDIVGEVLKIWQEWAASYDPIGKAVAEASHYKKVNVEGRPRKQKEYRSVIEIIRDDIRKTAAKFRASDMSHRLNPEQASRMHGTPRTIWNDLISRGLYAGQHVSVEKLIPLTLPRHTAPLLSDGVWVGGLRYMADELISSRILERVDNAGIQVEVYVMNMVTKHIWMELQGKLIKLTAVPVTINAADITHSMTLEESLYFKEKLAASRRHCEQDAMALEVANEIERQKDSLIVKQARSAYPEYQSAGKAETAQQHEQVYQKRK